MAMKKGDNPADFTVDEVNDYLMKTRSDEEVERIYTAEEAGKNRAGIMNTRPVDDEDEEEPYESPENGPESVATTPDVPEQGPALEEAPEAAPIATATAWTTDANGNPVKPVMPTRPYRMGQTFYPFEYTDSNLPDTIIPSEDVYSVIEYMGSKRKGSALAYPAGTPMPKAALDSIADDDTGRNGPVRERVEQ
jgi:hypothetical protein